MIIGIGTDLIEIARVRRVMEGYPERFMNRMFTPGEQGYINTYADPAPRAAGRFAVKESVMKALGTGWSSGVRWRDIEVIRHPSGRPDVQLHGRAKEIFEKRGGKRILCTITHSEEMAMAQVLFESE